MSYKRVRTDDLTKDYMISLCDFLKVLPNLKEAKNTREFELWFCKLRDIDKRSLYMYILYHEEDFPADYMRLVLQYSR